MSGYCLIAFIIGISPWLLSQKVLCPVLWTFETRGLLSDMRCTSKKFTWQTLSSDQILFKEVSQALPFLVPLFYCLCSIYNDCWLLKALLQQLKVTHWRYELGNEFTTFLMAVSMLITSSNLRIVIMLYHLDSPVMRSIYSEFTLWVMSYFRLKSPRILLHPSRLCSRRTSIYRFGFDTAWPRWCYSRFSHPKSTWLNWFSSSVNFRVLYLFD